MMMIAKCFEREYYDVKVRSKGVPQMYRIVHACVRSRGLIKRVVMSKQYVKHLTLWIHKQTRSFCLFVYASTIFTFRF